MNGQITFRTVLGLALLSGCMAVEAKPPTCTQPMGKWNDETKSVIEIKTYDVATGAISGEFTSRSGDRASSTPYPVVGWINSAPAKSSAPGKAGKAGKGDHRDVFTLAVRWGEHGSVTAWIGTCAVNSQSGLAQISTLWQTSRYNAEFEWRHTISGSEVFVPIE